MAAIISLAPRTTPNPLGWLSCLLVKVVLTSCLIPSLLWPPLQEIKKPHPPGR